MVQWDKRSPEIASLLNPAFCAVVLYSAVAEYQKKAKMGTPFPLLYLLLPIILHQRTRNRVNSRVNMVVWLQRNPDALVGFSERARSLVPFTNEAIEYLLFQQTVSIDNGEIVVQKPLSKSGIDKLTATDTEISDCVIKATHVGRWFSNMRAEENIYASWGVKP